jgi:CRISPR/Cas system-associated exonuclease Cas4 (RecB family)
VGKYHGVYVNELITCPRHLELRVSALSAIFVFLAQRIKATELHTQIGQLQRQKDAELSRFLLYMSARYYMCWCSGFCQYFLSVYDLRFSLRWKFTTISLNNIKPKEDGCLLGCSAV